METITLVRNSDDTLVFTPLNNKLPLDGNMVRRAVATVGTKVFDSDVDSGLVEWTDGGMFTINFRGECPVGRKPLYFRVYYADSTSGHVIIHPKYEDAAININCLASE
jgi:hypothetical protein